MLFLDRIFNRQSNAEMLKDILASTGNRETLLGVKNVLPPTEDQITRDAGRVLQYSRSQDYAVFAQEAWAEILMSLDKISSSKASDREIDFYRGRFVAFCDVLRISHRARSVVEESKNKEAVKANGHR
jgi:hypothetical protein